MTVECALVSAGKRARAPPLARQHGLSSSLKCGPILGADDAHNKGAAVAGLAEQLVTRRAIVRVTR